MATLSRVTGKLFGGSAPLDEIGQFGSAKAGSLYNTQDVATIQSLPAYSNGWGSAIITSRNFPPIEEVTGVLKTISYQNCYLLQEGVPVYDINTEYSATSIVKVINGNNLAFYISLVDGNIGNSLSDGTKWVKATFAERTIGEIVTSAIPLSDSGLHLLDGSLISGSGVYSQFVSYIADIYNSSLNYFCTEVEWQQAVSTYGVCGKFVYDSVNNTVRLPKITGFLEGTNGASTLGNLTEAGLPNITGTMKFNGTDPERESASSTGCITTSYWNTGGNDHDGEIGHGGVIYDFNAFRSSSIYGNSSTVQPQSIKVLYYIVVAETAKTDIEVDIDEIATDLNGKADVDLSNTNDTAKILMSGMGMPSETYVDLTLGASEATYTAPANGWVQFTQSITNGVIYLATVYPNSDGLCSKCVNYSSTARVMDVYLPVSKGETFKVGYTGTISSDSANRFVFVYAKGSESEAS